MFKMNKKGFTVIEFLAVMCVIAILVSLALPRFLGQTKEAKFTQLVHDAKLIEEAATRYYIARNDWPKTGNPYTKEQILELSETIYDSAGRTIDTSILPEGNYYDIDLKALSRYITIYSDPKNFVLYVPSNQVAVRSSKTLNLLSVTALLSSLTSEGSVYILDPSSNKRLTPSGPAANEPQSIRQPNKDEIPIYTPEELAAIGRDSTSLSGKYILMANLDLSSYSNWTPIGSNTTPFTGTFDGNGLVIKNLTINRPSSDYQGLFGYTGSGAKLANIKLEDVNVTGHNITGGLVGLNCSGTITNSYSTGKVTGYDKTGGLVGYSTGTIENSYSTGSVTGWNDFIGGLVGLNSGIITSSYSTNSVTGSGWDTGGLVGRNYYGTITSSYSTGNARGNYGGTGGLVGYQYLGAILNSYSTGSVSGYSFTGGLIGWNSGTVTNSYWDTQTSGITTSAGGTGKTTAQMKQQATFTGWDFTTVWTINEGVSYPYLRSNEQIPHPGIN